MLALSRDKGPKLKIVPAQQAQVVTAGGQVATEYVSRSKYVQFSPLQQGFKTNAIPTKWETERVWGWLDTAHEAERLGIPEEDIVKFLQNHRDNGRDFFLIDNGQAGDDSSEEKLYVGRREDGIVRLPEGGFYCELCKEGPIARWSGHLKKKSHVEAIQAREAHELQVIQGER